MYIYMHILFKTNKTNFSSDDDADYNKVTNGNNRTHTHTTARLNQEKRKVSARFADIFW